MGAIIGIANQKGGVAKTSTAIELAAWLSDMGKKVILLDLDQQGDSSRQSGEFDSQHTLYEVFTEKCKISESIVKGKLYDFIPSSPTFGKADVEFTNRDDIYLVSDVCEILKQKYDYIIIDNPPARNVLLNMTYVACDYIVVPTLADESSIRGLPKVESDLKLLRNTRNHESHAHIIGIILTCFDSITNSYKKAFMNLENLAEHLEGEKPFVMAARRTTKMNEIKSLHISLYEYDKWGNTSVDYKHIAEEIVRRCENEK